MRLLLVMIFRQPEASTMRVPEVEILADADQQQICEPHSI
jgi:hypothetical protein